jgi:SAM-dependent methyltransferase
MQSRWKAGHLFQIISEVRCLAAFLLKKRPTMTCTCCGFVGKFGISGNPPRANARCPECLSLERHRFLAKLISDNPGIVTGKNVLHFAPEASLRPLIEPLCRTYTACDLYPKPGDARVDIEQIDRPSGSFDLVICNHVLEHVDDVKALGEIRRVLTSTGSAILMVPMIEGWRQTYENEGVSTPSERHRHFGQKDHRRFYGADFRDRVTDSHFTLREITAAEPDVSRFALLRGEKIFIAEKGHIALKVQPDNSGLSLKTRAI